MSYYNNVNLIKACNLLNRVDNLLNLNSRVQISKDDCRLISDYISKSLKYIDPNIPDINLSYMFFSKVISELEVLMSDSSFIATNSITKDELSYNLHREITDFKVSIGKYLTFRDFSYTPAMDKLLKDIVDTCINEGYFFGY